jgi:hypothetical protein
MSVLLKAKQLVKRNEKGQGIAEMTVVTALLMFMAIGLFEVGHALWAYMTMLQESREVTRFLTRANVVDFQELEDYNSSASVEGYDHALTHLLTSNAGQLNLQEYFANAASSEDGSKATLILTHLVIDTGEPTADECNGGPHYTANDMILRPDEYGYGYLRSVYPESDSTDALFESRLDLDALVAELVQQNVDFNCKLMEKGSKDFSDNSVIVSEFNYEKATLTGLMFKQVPLYVQTMLRIDSNAAGRCEALPIALHKNVATKMQDEGGEHDMLQGNYESSGGFGWLSWKGAQSNGYLIEELSNPRLSGHDFINAHDTTDTDLSIGDYITSLTGVNNSSGVREQLELLMGQTVLIPVYDNVPGNGANAAYHVHSFARVRIGASDLPPGHGGNINATLIEWPADDACPSE